MNEALWTVIAALIVLVAALFAWTLRLQTQVNARPDLATRELTPVRETDGNDELMLREVVAWERVAGALTRMADAMNPPRPTGE